VNVNSVTFAKNGRSNIAFIEATVLKTTEAAASVASNVATALERSPTVTGRVATDGYQETGGAPASTANRRRNEAGP